MKPMKSKAQRLFFLLLTLFLALPLAWIYKSLDKIPALVLLLIPGVYLLNSLLRWKETAHIAFRIIVFLGILVSTIVIYYILFLENYTNTSQEIIDELPLDLLFHAGILGLIIAIATTVFMVLKIERAEKAELSLIGVITLVLLGITMLKPLFI